MDDSPFGADALLRQVYVHSKAVFSYAMTLMDKIREWEDEERWVAWTKGQRLGAEQEEYLKKRMLSIMICTNRVCAGVFVDHGWVSERTIIQHEEEILGLELNCKINVPCVVQWSLLWFSAPTELNNILGREQKIKKYHEVVDRAITYAISRPFRGRHTPRMGMLTSVARVLHNTHKKW